MTVNEMNNAMIMITMTETDDNDEVSLSGNSRGIIMGWEPVGPKRLSNFTTKQNFNQRLQIYQLMNLQAKIFTHDLSNFHQYTLHIKNKSSFFFLLNETDFNRSSKNSKFLTCSVNIQSELVWSFY